MKSHKESTRIINLIKKYEAVTYSAKVEVSTFDVFCTVMREVRSARPNTHVILASAPSSKEKLLFFGVSVADNNQLLSLSWMTHVGKSVANTKERELIKQEEGDMLQMREITYASDSEVFPFKLTDDVLSTGSAYLRANGLIKEEEEEHEYNFDDIE